MSCKKIYYYEFTATLEEEFDSVEKAAGQMNATDIDELILYSEETAEGETEKSQIVDRVRLAISKLPIGQRQVVTLVDLQEMSYAQVAETLDIPTGTVMSRLNRARKTLKQNLLSLHNELSSHEANLRIVK